jgi:hypothetical protein
MSAYQEGNTVLEGNNGVDELGQHIFPTPTFRFFSELRTCGVFESI